MKGLLLAAAAGAAVVVVWRWIVETAMAPLNDLDERWDTTAYDPYVAGLVASKVPTVTLKSVDLVGGEWVPTYMVADA